MMNPMQMFLPNAGQLTNNPLAMLLMTYQRGGNPMALIQQMAGQNPQAAMAIQLMQGKSPQQLRATAENMAKERGIDLNQFAHNLGLNIKI